MKAVDTRRLYLFEHTFLIEKPYLRKPRSIQFLRALADQVWAKHGRDGEKTPAVRITDGAATSSCLGRSEIELATATATYRNMAHNTVDTLLHELTHAMGYQSHGAGFARKYLELLSEYGQCDEGELRMAMTLFNVKH